MQIHKILKKYEVELSFALGILWIIYGQGIIMISGCDTYAKEYEDGWYLVNVEKGDVDIDSWGGSIEEPDTYHYDGPYDKQEIVNHINKCSDSAKKFMKSYGTIYRIFPSYEPAFIENTYGVMHFTNKFHWGLIASIISFFPLILIFMVAFIDYYKKR